MKGRKETFVIADLDGDKLADLSFKLGTSVTLSEQDFIL